MVATLLSAAPSGIPEPFLRAESTLGKFLLMFFAIAFFAAVFQAPKSPIRMGCASAGGNSGQGSSPEGCPVKARAFRHPETAR